MFPVDQSFILAKLQSYLQKTNKDPAVIKQFKENYYAGVSSLWLYVRWLQTQTYSLAQAKKDIAWYQATLKSIASWNEDMELMVESRGKQQVPTLRAQNFARFIALLEFFQDPKIYLPVLQEAPQKDLATLATLATKRKTAPTATKEYSIAALFTLENLQDLLKEEFIREHTLVFLNAYNHHATVLFKDGTTYYYFDPDNPVGEQQTDKPAELAGLIFHAYGLEARHALPVTFTIYSITATAPAPYPSPQTLLAKIKPRNESSSLYGRSSLQQAAASGCIESVKYFLQEKFSYTNINIAFGLAATQQHVEILRLLLASDKIDAVAVRIAFNRAVTRGNLAVVQELITSPKINSHTVAAALQTAVKQEQQEIITELLSSAKITAAAVAQAVTVATNDTIRERLQHHSKGCVPTPA